MSNRPRTAVAVALMLALSACGGTPAASEPARSEGVATIRPTSTPTVENPTPAQETTAEPDNGNGRPATITLVLSGTKTQSDGSYTSSGPARFCGDAVIHFTGNTRAFNFEFPATGDYEIGDVTFSADDLLPGSSTTVFHIGVNVTAKDGHEPPATVVDTALAGSDDTGSAQLSEAGGTTTLIVEGADEVGQSIHMTATCGRR